MHTVPTRGVQPLQPPAGFIHNISNDFIPFTITDEHRQLIPAHFIQVHMTADPYAITCLMINGSNYRAELHATPIEGKMTLEPISDQAI